MTPLQRIELAILHALPTLSLRPTLEKAAEVGGLLVATKAVCAHGHWQQWLKRVGLSKSSAWEYVTVYNHLDVISPKVRTTEI